MVIIEDFVPVICDPNRIIVQVFCLWGSAVNKTVPLHFHLIDSISYAAASSNRNQTLKRDLSAGRVQFLRAPTPMLRILHKRAKQTTAVLCHLTLGLTGPLVIPFQT